MGVFVFEGVGAGEEGLGRGDGSRVRVCIVIVIFVFVVVLVVVVILVSCVRCLEELRGGRRGRRADAPGDLIGLFVVRWRRVAVGSFPRSFHERLETRLHLNEFFLALRGGAALLGELLARALGDEPLAFGGLAAGGELPPEQQQRGSLSLLQHRITGVVTR